MLVTCDSAKICYYKKTNQAAYCPMGVMGKSPLGQKPTRTKAHWTISHWTKVTAKFGRVDKSPLFEKNRFKSFMKLITLTRLLIQGKSHLQCVFTEFIISPVYCDKQLNLSVKRH